MIKIGTLAFTATVAATIAIAGSAAPTFASAKPTVKFGASSPNPVAAVHTAITTVSDVPDSGFDGNTWGYDTFKLAFTWVRVRQVSKSECGAKAVRCYLYDWSAKDSGTTQTIEGQESPGEPFTALDVVEHANLSATESGQYLSSYKRVYTQYVPTSYEANGTASGTYYNDISDGTWFSLAQPGSYEVNTTANTFAWSFTYDVPKGNDSLCPNGTWKWVDAYNVSEANSGNILAPNAADCSAQS